MDKNQKVEVQPFPLPSELEKQWDEFLKGIEGAESLASDELYKKWLEFCKQQNYPSPSPYPYPSVPSSKIKAALDKLKASVGLEDLGKIKDVINEAIGLLAAVKATPKEKKPAPTPTPAPAPAPAKPDDKEKENKENKEKEKSLLQKFLELFKIKSDKELSLDEFFDGIANKVTEKIKAEAQPPAAQPTPADDKTKKDGAEGAPQPAASSEAPAKPKDDKNKGEDTEKKDAGSGEQKPPVDDKTKKADGDAGKGNPPSDEKVEVNKSLIEGLQNKLSSFEQEVTLLKRALSGKSQTLKDGGEGKKNESVFKGSFFGAKKEE